MANPVVEIIIKAKNQAKKALDEAADGLSNLKKSAGDADSGVGSFSDKWSMALLGVNQTLEILEKAYQAFDKIYNIAREGADLLYVQDRFDNLTESIGTTSDALMGDLRDATRGLYSDAELMQSATDFMQLGLAKTSEEAIRLSTVASALGMNMNQLTLTLTNQTTMRFDAIGMSVDGFKEKVKELEDAGMDANDAFKEAFLQQAEKQIEKVGHAADSAIGGFMRLESAMKNAADTAKKDFAESMSGVVDSAANYIDKTNDWQVALIAAKDAGVDTADVVRKLYTFQMTYAEATETVTDRLDDYVGTAEEFDFAMRNAVNGTNLYDDSAEMAAAHTAELADETGDLAIKLFDGTQAAFDFRRELEEMLSLDKNFGGIIGMAEKYDDTLNEIAENEGRIAELMGDTTEEGIEERDALIAKNDELNQSMQDMANQMVLDMYKMEIALDGVVTGDEMDAYFQMAEDFGLISEDAADQAIAAYMRAKGIIENNAIVVKITGIDGIEKDLARLTRDRTVTIRTSMMGGYGDNTRYGEAAGGLVHAASGASASAPYWVGELGPEPFFPSQDGRIVSNSEAKAAMRSGGSKAQPITVVINTPMNFADRVWVENELAPYIRDAMARAQL